MDDLPAHKKPGLRKIEALGRIALEHDIRAFWIDTCCIDKKSSEELGEAIRSMYRWYREASVCFAYLDDVEVHLDMRRSAHEFGWGVLASKHQRLALFRKVIGEGDYSEWFQRAWTLQELIAPKDVIFLDRNWRYIGKRSERSAELSEITGIDERLLLGGLHPAQFSIAQRMSWASRRRATRIEDEAYSLLGLFKINMSTLYGEGRHAFVRLQKEIIAQSADQSILAWTSDSVDSGTHLLASSPKDFANSSDIVPMPLQSVRTGFHITKVGLEIPISIFRPQCKCTPECLHDHGLLARLDCQSLTEPTSIIALPLSYRGKIGQQSIVPQYYIRSQGARLYRLPRSRVPHEYQFAPIILTDGISFRDEIPRRRFLMIQIDSDFLDKIDSTYPRNAWSRREGFNLMSEEPPRIICLDVIKFSYESQRIKQVEVEGYICFSCKNGMKLKLCVSYAGICIEFVANEDRRTPQNFSFTAVKPMESEIVLRAFGYQVLLSPRQENVLGTTETIHHLSIEAMDDEPEANALLDS